MFTTGDLVWLPQKTVLLLRNPINHRASAIEKPKSVYTYRNITESSVRYSSRANSESKQKTYKNNEERLC